MVANMAAHLLPGNQLHDIPDAVISSFHMFWVPYYFLSSRLFPSLWLDDSWCRPRMRAEMQRQAMLPISPPWCMLVLHFSMAIKGRACWGQLRGVCTFRGEAVLV